MMSHRRRGSYARYGLPNDLWDERDWREYHEDQAARARRAQGINVYGPAIQPQHQMPQGFGLHPPRTRGRDARGRAVDAVLAQFGIRPRGRRPR